MQDQSLIHDFEGGLLLNRVESVWQQTTKLRVNKKLGEDLGAPLGVILDAVAIPLNGQTFHFELVHFLLSRDLVQVHLTQLELHYFRAVIILDKNRTFAR